MTNAQILSPRPSIDEALEFLGMSNMDKVMAIEALLKITRDDNLPLFFDKSLTCVPVSLNYGDQFDEYGKYVETRFVNREDEREFWSMHIPYFYHLAESADQTFHINLGGVIHDGIVYDICIGNRRVAAYISIEYEKFYFVRDQLIDFKTGYTTRFFETQVKNDKFSKRPSMLELRKTAFKYWLVGNSGKSIHSNDELQACYVALGEPTKRDVWKRLQAMDSELFRSGKDDFLKAASSVIQFKQGTGKARNR